MLTTEWPMVLLVAIALIVLLGVISGYVSARVAVIGSERRLNRTLSSRLADV